MGEAHIALVSGGMDSAVAAHVAEREEGMECLVYLDTGTGLRENKDYLEELADWMGLQLWTLRTHVSYEERCRKNGFPGAGDHGIMYRSLKERQLGKLATVVGGRGAKGALVLWTGVRARESRNRSAYVEPEQDHPRWTWRAPIHDWSKQDCRGHVEEHDLPRNPLWEDLGRSGDCFCGCFGSRAELTDLRGAGLDYHADWIRELEGEVDELNPELGEKSVWGWSGLSDHERRAARAERDSRQRSLSDIMLCSSCELRGGP